MKAKDDMKALLKDSHLAPGSVSYVDSLYESYLSDPNSISNEWRQYFNDLPEGKSNDESHQAIVDYFFEQAKHKKVAIVTDSSELKKQAHVTQLVNAYRTHGHHHAALDPIHLRDRKEVPDLTLVHHKLTNGDLSHVYTTESKLFSNGASVKDIFEALNKTYCSSIGVEYMHITEPAETKWIADKLESVHSHPVISDDSKRNLLKELSAAEGIEHYLHNKYVGQKRFSLEGADSIIPMLNMLIQRAGKQNVREVIVGMAHRGRLNVLVNVFGKATKVVFEEFEGVAKGEMSGDVKYHLGYSTDISTPGGVVHSVLAFNPSHLEIIAPVVEGSVRARQRRRDDIAKKEKVVPIIIHGDAAFAGQGVVMETFNLSQARGYSTGGTVHIVINNQIGFTTSNPLDSRSTLYCTDIAKMVQSPVFHVNGDDPEAVMFVTELAFDYRMKFKKDVVIDLVCYRKHGHNEADEPSVTQPFMYSHIKKMSTTKTLYADKLIEQGVVTSEDVQKLSDAYRQALDNGEAVVDAATGTYEDKYAVDWEPFINRDWREKCDTTVDKKSILRLAKKLETLPGDFEIHPIVKRLLNERAQMTKGEIPINWGYAETLAYATLLESGFNIRLSGQDCGRGTFAHRHAVLHHSITGEQYAPLQHISDDQNQFIIIDSILSEEAVLGFEYGYATAEPNTLVIWEAQFGDFANGAQVVIDQFISSGEQKWGRLCGLVMLLPHGYEGQGPEHSSARLERYLQLCAEHNMQVCVPSNPAQVFHMLRRQAIRPYRKPLIVLTPKSLLRHKMAVSELSDLTGGEFQLIIPEIDEIKPDNVRKVVLCSGKVYYDLLKKRRDKKQKDVAIVRIEQLYPFPEAELKGILKTYSKAKDIIWCQEEPKNQGAWYASSHHMRACFNKEHKLHYAGRDMFAAPAVGSAKLHKAQQNALVEEALK